jgi:hypothetical protein
MDYYKVMKLLYDVYLGPNSENIVSLSLKKFFILKNKTVIDWLSF